MSKPKIQPKCEVSLPLNAKEFVFRASIIEAGRITIPAQLRHQLTLSTGVGVRLRLLSFFVDRDALDEKQNKIYKLQKIEA